MSVVCLDTQILQWGMLKRVHDPQISNVVNHAVAFIAWLASQKKTNIIIPSIVVGELLIPVAPTQHSQTLAEISSKWIVVDYDLRAARLFAEITQARAVREIRKQLLNGNPNLTRSHLKADVMILATAVAQGADYLYSGDKALVALANTQPLNAVNFLDVPLQRPFPDIEA